MATLVDNRTAYRPKAPEVPEDLGIPTSLVRDLILRRVYISGIGTFQALGQALKLSYTVVESVFRDLKQQQLVEVKGTIGNDYSFTLTNAGKAVALERFQTCQYAGATPVSLKHYHWATKAQAAKVTINRPRLKQAFSDLVIPDKMLDQLGPAIISQTSIFLYGPTGNGKTSIAERMLRVYDDMVLIPYAVEVDGQIVIMYDPVVHEKIDLHDDELDPRWVPCCRPIVVAGGELTTSMLELKLDEATGIYAAPPQMKANNGVFVVDDFGRQMISPRELLNRWIVPLDRRVDYLTLRYGVKFQIPFEVMVIFATNLEPSDLADEAFLRRLHNKVLIEPVAPETFDEIFRRVAASRRIACDDEVIAYVRELCVKHGTGELRACYPTDICKILVTIAEYEGRAPRLDRDDLARAVQLYFTQKEED